MHLTYLCNKQYIAAEEQVPEEGGGRVEGRRKGEMEKGKEEEKREGENEKGGREKLRCATTKLHIS